MAFSLTKLAENIWRNYISDGVPASGKNKPSKADIRTWGGEVETMLAELYTLASDISGDFSISSVQTAAQITSNQNNYSPTDWDSYFLWRISSDAARTITGFAALTGHKVRVLLNVGSFVITILPNHASSSAGNRLIATRPIGLRPYQPVTLIYDDDLAGWVQMYQPATHQPLPSSFKNLVITVTSNTALTVTADYIMSQDSLGDALRLSSVSLTVDITTSGANGLDTGSEASSTWYYVWVAYNPKTATTIGLLSTNSSAPTLPTDYSHYIRVGAVRNDGSSNLLRTLQRNDQAQYVIGTNPTVPRIIANGSGGTYSDTNPVYASTSIASFVPSTARSIIIMGTNKYQNGTLSKVLVAPNTAWGGTGQGISGSNGVTVAYLDSGAFSTGIWEFVLEGTTIGYAANNTGAAISCLGWRDQL